MSANLNLIWQLTHFNHFVYQSFMEHTFRNGASSQAVFCTIKKESSDISVKTPGNNSYIYLIIFASKALSPSQDSSSALPQCMGQTSFPHPLWHHEAAPEELLRS